MARFDYFVVFAEMRTGSNFLEENLNLYPDLSCHGEAFNPHFIAYPSVDNLFGISQPERDQDPMRVVMAVRDQSDGIGGFRYFHDHDPRVFEACIDDPRCAKVVLTRNPAESFVSWKIASATGQWKLTNATHHKSEKVHFDGEEFEAHLAKLQNFQVQILNRLQRTGQTAFYVAYEDVQDLNIMNGLAKYLGSKATLDSLSKKLKKQNPKPMSDKVENFEAMEVSLARLDRFNLTRTPNFEPRRGPVVPSYIAAARAPLLFMPIKAGPDRTIRQWLADVDGVTADDLQTQFTQKSLRQWKRQNKGHRSFTVVRHPAARAYDAFCQYILPVGPGTFAEVRKTLRRVHNVPLPPENPGPEFSIKDMRAAFVAFLTFLKANLSGQTALRVDTAWASQAAIIQGLADFAAPDLIVREDLLQDELAFLSAQVGVPYKPVTQLGSLYPFELRDVYDDTIEDLVRDAYQKDYLTFGFAPYGKG